MPDDASLNILFVGGPPVLLQRRYSKHTQGNDRICTP